MTGTIQLIQNKNKGVDKLQDLFMLALSKQILGKFNMPSFYILFSRTGNFDSVACSYVTEIGNIAIYFETPELSLPSNAFIATEPELLIKLAEKLNLDEYYINNYITGERMHSRVRIV